MWEEAVERDEGEEGHEKVEASFASCGVQDGDRDAEQVCCRVEEEARKGVEKVKVPW